MVQSLNGQATSLPTDLLAEADDERIDAVAAPSERPAEEPEPEENADEDESDPDDIDIVDDDDDAEPAPEQDEAAASPGDEPDDEPTTPAQKGEWRKTTARNMTSNVRKALNGELDPRSLNASERLIYKDQKAYRDEIEKPVKRTQEDASWSRYASLWQANLTNPQQFNELWRDPQTQEFWLHMERNRAALGLHPGIDPQTFRERFDEYNASLGPGEDSTSANEAAEEYYEELQDNARFWSSLSAEEKETLAPTKFKGTTTQILTAMARQAGRLESDIKARKARRPVEERVAEVNKTATNAKAAAKGAPLGVVRGGRPSMTVQQIRDLAAKGDPQGLKLYAKWKAQRAKTA